MTRAPRYPELVSSGKRTLGTPSECACCASPATHFAWVRADAAHAAEVLALCGRHESIARQGAQGVARMLSHIQTKGRFLEDPDALKDEVRQRREREEGR